MKTTLILFLIIALTWHSEAVVKNYPEVLGGSPWQVAIYEKRYEDYVYRCAGTILTEKIVISNADCFGDVFGGQKDAGNFRIGAGKLLREWNDVEDTAQKKTGSKIIRQAGYKAVDGLYKDDVALLIVDSAFQFNDNVKPVKLDFSIFEDGRIPKYAIGKVSGWGILPGSSDPDAAVLRTLNVPVVEDTEDCRDLLDSTDRNYLIDEKICCGYINDYTDCITDTGSGLVFPYEKDGKTEYYLRGLVKPRILTFRKTDCVSSGVYIMTDVIYHRKFIEDSLKANK